MEIGSVSLVVEIDKQLCAVVLPQEKLQLVVQVAASLSKTGKLPVKKLSEEYRLEELQETKQ